IRRLRRSRAQTNPCNYRRRRWNRRRQSPRSPLPDRSRPACCYHQWAVMIVPRRHFLAGIVGALAVAPARGAEELTPGEHSLGLGSDRDGVIYVPPQYKAGVSMPLVVMLHGAGG